MKYQRRNTRTEGRGTRGLGTAAAHVLTGGLYCFQSRAQGRRQIAAQCHISSARRRPATVRLAARLVCALASSMGPVWVPDKSYDTGAYRGICSR